MPLKKLMEKSEHNVCNLALPAFEPRSRGSKLYPRGSSGRGGGGGGVGGKSFTASALAVRVLHPLFQLSEMGLTQPTRTINFPLLHKRSKGLTSGGCTGCTPDVMDVPEVYLYFRCTGWTVHRNGVTMLGLTMPAAASCRAREAVPR